MDKILEIDGEYRRDLWNVMVVWVNFRKNIKKAKYVTDKREKTDQQK